jgi:hypothetical protein
MRSNQTFCYKIAEKTRVPTSWTELCTWSVQSEEFHSKSKKSSEIKSNILVQNCWENESTNFHQLNFAHEVYNQSLHVCVQTHAPPTFLYPWSLQIFCLEFLLILMRKFVLCVLMEISSYSDGDLKWELIKVDHLNLHFLWGCDQVMPKCKSFHTFFAAPCKLHLLLIVSTTAVPAPFFVGYWCRKWKSRIQQHHPKKRLLKFWCTIVWKTVGLRWNTAEEVYSNFDATCESCRWDATT